MDRNKEKSGIRTQTPIAIPPLLMTDARCRTTGGGVQGIGQRQVGYRLDSAESITDVKTCNRVRTASDEEVQNSGSKVAEQGTQIEFNLVS